MFWLVGNVGVNATGVNQMHLHFAVGKLNHQRFCKESELPGVPTKPKMLDTFTTAPAPVITTTLLLEFFMLRLLRLPV